MITGECEKLISLFQRNNMVCREQTKTPLMQRKDEYAYARLAYVYAYTIMNGNIDQLKKLYEEHRGSEWIAINYSWGLGKLAEKQELPESTETVQFFETATRTLP
jgi:hypothetical protein